MRLPSIITLMAVLSISGVAQASGGFDTAYFGGPFGQAVGDTPFAVYYNPAALTLTKRAQLSLDLMTGFHGARYRRTATTVPEPADAKNANLGKARLFDVLAGPALAGSLRFGELTLGAGLYSPVAGSQSWDKNDKFRGNLAYPGAYDGRARFHLIEGSFLLLNGTLAASYRVKSTGLSLGAGANLNYTHITLVRALTPSFDDAITNHVEQRTDIAASGFTGSFSVGLVWQSPQDRVAVGLSYQAPPGLYDGQVLPGHVRTSFGGIVQRNEADLHQTMPDVIRWGLRVRATRDVELRLYGDYTRWSLLERQCLTQRGETCDIASDGSEVEGNQVLSNHERRWQDTVAVNVGVSFFLSQRAELLFGAGYDSNAVPDATLDPSLIDGHDLTGSFGGRVRLADRFRLTASYAHTTWLPRDTQGKSERDSLAHPSRMPTSDGEYFRWLGILTCLLEVSFD